MGKGSHGGFHGTPGGNGFHTFTDNLPSLIARFPLTGRHFGDPSEKKNSVARVIRSTDPLRTAKEFFRLATQGGEIVRQASDIAIAKLKDGAHITFRVTSTSDGSPVVDLNISSSSFIRTRKIHFIKETSK